MRAALRERVDRRDRDVRPDVPELRDCEAPFERERVDFVAELLGFAARFEVDFALRARFIFPVPELLFVAAPLPFARGWLIDFARFVARFVLAFFALVLRPLRVLRPRFTPELRFSSPRGIVHLQESFVGLIAAREPPRASVRAP